MYAYNFITNTSVPIRVKLISSMTGAVIRTSSISTIVITLSIATKTLIYICKIQKFNDDAHLYTHHIRTYIATYALQI